MSYMLRQLWKGDGEASKQISELTAQLEKCKSDIKIYQSECDALLTETNELKLQVAVLQGGKVPKHTCPVCAESSEEEEDALPALCRQQQELRLENSIVKESLRVVTNEHIHAAIDVERLRSERAELINRAKGQSELIRNQNKRLSQLTELMATFAKSASSTLETVSPPDRPQTDPLAAEKALASLMVGLENHHKAVEAAEEFLRNFRAESSQHQHQHQKQQQQQQQQQKQKRKQGKKQDQHRQTSLQSDNPRPCTSSTDQVGLPGSAAFMTLEEHNKLIEEVKRVTLSSLSSLSLD